MSQSSLQGGNRMEGHNRRRDFWRWVPLAAVGLVLGVGYALGLHRYVSLGYLAEAGDMLAAWSRAHPVLAPVLFMAVCAGAVACAFPVASIFTVFGGFLFGWLAGGLMSAVAVTAGTTVFFVVARTAFGDMLTRRLKGRAARIAAGFDENAFSYLMALRMMPAFPALLVTLAAALARMGVGAFVGATFVGILPATLAYAWLGEGAGSVLDAARAAGRQAGLRDLVTPELTIAFVLLAVIAFIPPLVRSRRRRD